MRERFSSYFVKRPISANGLIRLLFYLITHSHCVLNTQLIPIITSSNATFIRFYCILATVVLALLNFISRKKSNQKRLIKFKNKLKLSLGNIGMIWTVVVDCRFGVGPTNSWRGARGTRSSGSCCTPPSPPGRRCRSGDEALEATDAPGHDAFDAPSVGVASSAAWTASPSSRATSRGRRGRWWPQGHPRRQRTLGKIPQTRHGNGHHKKWQVKTFLKTSFNI